MSRSRLDLIAADLDTAIGARQAHAVALLAVHAALAAHPTAEPAVREALQSLQAHDRKAALLRRPDIVAVAERLDEEYLGLYAAAGEVNTPSVIAAFSRARAVAALGMALDTDETMAAKEAIYEAYAALGDTAGEEMLTSIRSAIAAP